MYLPYLKETCGMMPDKILYLKVSGVADKIPTHQNIYYFI